jgi:HD-GYP domain-containing protein (c-di-GMP phosphodiesterase class II)
MPKIRKLAKEKRVRLSRSLTSRQARTLVFSLALMTAVILVTSAAFFGLAAALMCLTVILGLATWRESRVAKHEKQSVQNRLDKLGRERGSVIEVLCNALGLEENMKSAQAQRVADLAASVAWQMGLKEDQVRAVRQAAILHDVGKIGIAEDVLSKAETLTDREWQTMMRHPEVGHEILSEVPSFRLVAEVIQSHHERFDGQGYPRGVKGDEIPIASRIYAVVDAYAAMISERPYRKKMDHDMAVREIVRNSLTQFDPQVVQAFLEAMEATTPRSASASAANGRPYAEETVSSQV